MREFQSSEPISREEWSDALGSGDSQRIASGLVRLAFCDHNGAFVETQCLALLADQNQDLRRVAVTCLGHVARIHREFSNASVPSLLRGLISDPAVSEQAQDALDDVAVFLGKSRNT